MDYIFKERHTQEKKVELEAEHRPAALSQQ